METTVVHHAHNDVFCGRVGTGDGGCGVRRSNGVGGGWEGLKEGRWDTGWSEGEGEREMR
jgi:hypothetical protein